MSGLFILGVLVLWILLTSVLWKSWRHFAREKHQWRDRIALVLALCWIGASFWYAGGRKYYYDWHVERMCVVDGGVTIYETVNLPAEMIDKYGVIRIPNKRQSKPSDMYYYDTTLQYLRNGDPKISRRQSQIIRRSDEKILGEYISYARSGGDLPGPWHPSSFICPDPTMVSEFETSIFAKENAK